MIQGAKYVHTNIVARDWRALGACRELAPSKQESTTYEPSLVCKLLILGCRLLIPDRLLAAFYQDVLGCVPVPPERDLKGPVLEAGTGVRGAELRGMHLRLPGFSSEGPTLEIFEYSEPAPGPKPAVNRPGLAHLAFSVPSVAEAQELVLAHGGTAVGEIVTLATANGAEVTWCYVRDPEGNIVELQSWAHAGAPASRSATT